MRLNCERCGATENLKEIKCKCGSGLITICKTCLPIAASCISDIPCQLCRISAPSFLNYYHYLFSLEDPRR